MKILLKDWILEDLKENSKMHVEVPGDITDYYRANKIEDPYFGLNHNKNNELGRRDYLFTTEFKTETFDKDKYDAFLVLKGVDLFSDVYFNDKLLGNTDNMFKEFKFKISDIIKSDNNKVKIRLRSTLNYMDKLDCSRYFGVFNTPRVLLRKEQCCFGWDWVPNIPGYGIYKDVEILIEPKQKIENVKCIAGSDKKAVFVVELNYCYRSYYDNQGNFIHINNPYKDEIRVTLSEDGDTDFKNAQVKIVPVNGRRLFVTFNSPNAKLWWPSGYGEQPLYPYKIELIRDGKVISVADGYIAYRSVELVQSPLGDTLMGYQIKINGENIFIKGSNWVPIDCFTGSIKKEKYLKLINQAKAANYNMLRIWGGGIYEDDIFYQTCDKLGVMVWQDFMFACADIPDDNEQWLKNTIEECKYQIKRLRNYPCIVYWCGGNEKTGNFGSLISFGDNFVDVTLRGLVGDLDGTRPYARQSPCSWTDIGNDFHSGESHFGSFGPTVLGNSTEYRKYVNREIVPFSSENATMGPVSRQSYERFFPKDKLWPMNDLWKDRCLNNPYADEKEREYFYLVQKKYVKEFYGEPSSLDEFIAKGMNIQAEFIKCDIEMQRFLKGMTFGYMNWMYSDMWPTATWAVVDYYTEPKQVYYQMAKSYKPILMSFVQDKAGDIVLFGVNDTLKDEEFYCEYGLKTLDGKVIWQKTASGILKTENNFKIKVENQIETHNAYLFVNYMVNGKTETTLFSLDFWRTCEFKSVYSVEILEKKNRSAVIKVKADEFVKSAFICFPDNYKFTYSDNYIDIEKGGEKIIEISAENDFDIKDMEIFDFTRK